MRRQLGFRCRQRCLQGVGSRCRCFEASLEVRVWFRANNIPLRTIMSTQDMFCNFPNPFHTQSWSLKVPSSTFENFNTNKNSFLSHSFVQKNSVAGAWLVQTGCKQLFGFLSALETLSGIFYRPPSHEEDCTWPKFG